jgi:sn-glycerol 3-phosphate transport system substrate-binding protein
MMKRFLLSTLAASLTLAAPLAQAQVEVQLWHAMTGALGERVNALATDFNSRQKEYKVVSVFKGNYDETLSAGIAAYRAKKAPHILQVYEVGTATMMAATGAVKPAYEVMQAADRKWNPNGYIPAVTSYFTNSKGQMLSFPFNSSTTVMYINKDAYKKAGLNPDQPPKTWKELQDHAYDLRTKGGMACGYTTGWQSWVHLENTSAWHDLPFATKDNGFGGTDAKLAFNDVDRMRHIALLSSWAKSSLFTYGGRRNEAEAKFFGGECGILTSSSAALANIKRNAKFEFGVARLPYHEEVKGAPQNTIIGGASLWVMQGHKATEYKGVAAFFEYLASTDVAVKWHQETGYLPLTQAAYDATKKSGFYDKNPGTDISVLQMTNKKPTANSKGIRLGNFVQIREIIDEELEQVWAAKKTPKDALDDAVRRGNEQLAKFAAANKGKK